jgi:uncharacterized protein
LTVRARRISRAVYALLLLGVAAGGAAREVPFLSGRVVDEANLLSPEQRQRIEARLEDFERRTGNQLAVLTVPSLEGEEIADYSHKVASTWKLGQKGKDNGVLLLVAKNDRKMRIEVGYGLEPVLTDLQTKVIQDEVIIPHFRQNDFGGGLEAGVDAILGTIEGKEVQPARAQERPAGGGRDGGGCGFLPFLLLLLGPFSLDAIRSRSWLLYIFLMPFYFFLGYIISPVVGIIAAGLWAVLFPILRMVLPKSLTGRRGGGGFLGPWLGGGGGGWSSGGGGWGGGGGGFSGGGGSFGGGGSSSSW